jgi:glycosyltransferase involved in cell wall biosynthesis
VKFLHITTFYPPYHFGGDAMYIYRLSHALAEAGHKVDVVHCVDSYHLLHPGPPPIRFAEHPNVVRHELRSGMGALSPLLTQQTGRPWLKKKSIQDVLGAGDHDVIQFHNISLIGPGVLRMNNARGNAVKMYMTHEHWLVCPLHVLWKFNSRPCEKPECLKCTLHGRRPPQLWRYTGYLERCARHVDQFVSPSRFTARMHADRRFPVPVAHLPYFIDRADDDWQNPGPRPQEKPYFLFVGRLEVIKGLQNVIGLWNQRAPEWDLLVAGTGAADKDLRALAASNPRIKFLGARSQRELGTLYYHALACIIPSVTFETFGMINIEAFARKTPVIAHDLGALPEVVEDSGGGFVYRTQEELLDSARRIAESPRLRAELGERGYRAFVQHWTREAHLHKYFGYIDACRERKRGKTAAEAPLTAQTS